jgi:hypothetical protein
MLQRFEHWIALLQLSPGAQFQERFRSPHWAGVARHNSLRRRAVAEERHTHGYPQTLPLRVTDLKTFQCQAALGDKSVLASTCCHLVEEERACSAGALDLPRGHLQEVSVCQRYGLATQVTAFLHCLYGWRGQLRQPLQRCERFAAPRLSHAPHPHTRSQVSPSPEPPSE